MQHNSAIGARDSRSYDATGNLTNSYGGQLHYNARGELTDTSPQACLAGAKICFGATRYSYNASGERVSKETPYSIFSDVVTEGSDATAPVPTRAAATRHESYAMFDEAGQILLETTTDVSQYPCLSCRDPYVEYIYLDGVPIAALHDPTGPNGLSATELYADHLGTPRQANNAGTQSWGWDALSGSSTGGGNSFGARSSTGTGSSINLRFPGQQYDWQTGLHYNYMRFYEPRTGRYITSDPIGLGGGMNTYLYANGNPLMFSDRLGLFSMDPVWGAIHDSTGYEPDDSTVDFWAGMGDGASFGLTDWMRDLHGTNEMVNKCSLSYLGGTLGSMAMTPLGRLGYMARASQIPKLAQNGRQAVAMRNFLRYQYRFPLSRWSAFFATWHMRTYVSFVARGKEEAEIIANSGNISGLWNYLLLGGAPAISGSMAELSQDDCECGG